MSTRRVTPWDAKSQIERLVSGGYALPERGKIDGLAKTWADVLTDVDERDLEAAVGAYLRDGGRFFPRPSEIRKLAIEARRSRPAVAGQPGTLLERYLAWEQRPNFHDGAPCPVCGALPTWAPRLVVVHDEREHERAGVRWSGSCRAHQEFYAQADRDRERQAEAKQRKVAEDEQRERQAAVERQRVAQKISPLLLEAAKLETEEVGI